MLVALLALFVALGGPAQAKHLIDGKTIRRGSVASKQIKDCTITALDLAPEIMRTLQSTADGSITPGMLVPDAVRGPAIADGTVAAADIADGAIGSGKLVDGSVTGAKIAEGTLTTADIARFSGAFRILAEDLGTPARRAASS
jgi:hypothetical protein